MEEPDPRTIRAAAGGDDDAFAVLMRVSQPHVWRFLRHLLGDADHAADATQETFVRVHRSLPRFRFEARFSTWVFSIARNVAIDEQRRQGRRLRLQRALTPPSPQPDGALGAELRAALASLSPRLREAFVLVEVFGQPYQDAAEVLAVPIGTVKSRVFRARLDLVQWFDGRQEEELGG
jgi:RNA polymerase sigma-70 factor (ECF subfamily)